MANQPQLNDLARIRSTRYETVQDLADDIAVVLEGLSRQQTYKRGVNDKKLVEIEGGTVLSVADPSIGRKSINMQMPQTLTYRYHGGIGSRSQRRTDIVTETVPAIVLGVDGTGDDAMVTLRVIGNKPLLYRDSASGQNVVGNPQDMLEPGADASQADQFTVRMAGLSFASGSDAGITPPVAGQTVMVAITSASEKATVWMERNRSHQPVVRSVDYAPKATIVNNLCCQDEDDGGGGGS